MSPEELEWGLASQFDLRYVCPEADSIDPEAAALVSPEWALAHLTLPILKTVDRIIDVFPAGQQEQIRAMLTESLKGVTAQVLLKNKNGKGHCAVLEIMVDTNTGFNFICENKIHQILSMLQTGKKDGMQILDQHILECLMSGVISAE